MVKEIEKCQCVYPEKCFCPPEVKLVPKMFPVAQWATPFGQQVPGHKDKQI